VAGCPEGIWPGKACPELVEGALYNRRKRWSDKGIFIRMMEGLATRRAPDRKTIMIDATYLKAHRTASSLGVKKGVRDA
jgi:transposase